MQQILNITRARNDLSNIISKVAREKRKVVIVRDSMPEAVLVPYDEYVKEQNEKEKLWQLRFERLLSQGKKSLKKWAKKNKVDMGKLSEEKMYELVEKA
jgi:prevent-host-death family protein